ncbi:MAG: DMT family transporter [Propionibacteriaceae bacterium]|nr:DMT family transporter [Propionibacteriaceae bacterium]
MNETPSGEGQEASSPPSPAGSAPASNRRTLQGSALLTLTSLIWGFSFVAQRAGMDHIGPFLFNGLRYLLGAFSLYVVICWRQRGLRPDFGLTRRDGRQPIDWSNPTIKGGLLCGLALFCASVLQQIGVITTPAGKAGFLTALYIVLVPVIGLLIGRRTRWNTWLAGGLALVGLYLLCLTEDLSIEPGNLVVLGGALFWAGHILVTDHFVRWADVLRLCCIQFLTAGALSLPLAWLLDSRLTDQAASGAAIWSALPAIAFTGILSSGVAFSLQAFSQRYVAPAVASLIMSLESVFAVIGGAVVLGETLTHREMVGCLIMLVAVLLAQLPFGRRRVPVRLPDRSGGGDEAETG